MKRQRFLDWARGVAVIIMIVCHTFNSFTSLAQRNSTGYVLSQRVGGMASVLFLFMAGMTFAYQMSGSDRRGGTRTQRWGAALRRAGYVLALAYAFRLANWAFYFPTGNWQGFYKVDILNCMGLAMGALSVLALVPPSLRAAVALAAGCSIAAASPLIGMLDWSGIPKHLHAYIVGQRGAFAAFPFASYMAFGLGAGVLVRRQEELGRLMQYAVLAGAAAMVAGKYLAWAIHAPYPQLDYWLNSPALVSINLGVTLLVLAGSYLWCEHLAAGGGWSWVETLGKQSLLVYFVHIMIVYGWIFAPWKSALAVWQSALVTAGVMVAMVGLAQWRLNRNSRRLSQQPPLAASTGTRAPI